MKKYIYLGSIIIVLAGIYLFNFLTPMWNDDYVASFNYADQAERISSIKQIIKSQIWTYFNWSGGVINLALQQIVSVWVKKPVFDVLNTVVITSAAYLVCYASNKLNIKYFLVVLSFIWLFAPSPGETILWMIASICYLWSTIFCLAYLIFQSQIKNNFLFFSLSFVVGALLINTSVILIPFYLLLLLIDFKKTRHLDKRRLLGLIFMILGFLFFFLAPGNFQRFQNMYVEIPLIQRLPNFYVYLETFLMNNWIPILLVIIVSIDKIRKNTFREFIKDQYTLLFIIALLSPLTMIIAPEYSERTTFSSFIFLLPITLSSYDYLMGYIKKSLIVDSLNLSIFFICFIQMILFLESKIIVFNIDIKNKIAIAQAKQEGNLNVELDVYPIKSNKYSFIYNIRKDKNYIANIHMANYYDLEFVRSKGDYLRITFDKILIGNYQLELTKTDGSKYLNSQIVYNKFDGKSVFFDLIQNSKKDSIYRILIKPNIEKIIKIKSIEICKNNKFSTIKDTFSQSVFPVSQGIKNDNSQTYQVNKEGFISIDIILNKNIFNIGQ